jgi:hypothetical protein
MQEMLSQAGMRPYHVELDRAMDRAMDQLDSTATGLIRMRGSFRMRRV